MKKFKLIREYVLVGENREDVERQLREAQDEMDVTIGFDENLIEVGEYKKGEEL